MKRVAMFVMVVMLTICLLSSAFADEILFRGVPWGVNPKEARKKIDDPNTYMQTTVTTGLIAYPSKTVERLMDSSKNFIFGNPECFAQEEGTTRVAAFFISDPPKVAGYNIQMVEMDFASDIQDGKVNDDEDASHFAIANYIFDIIDGKSAYADLKTKLTSLYGEGKEVTGDYNGSLWYDGKAHDYSTHTNTITFTGDNGTHALLVCVESVAAEEPDKPAYEVSLSYWCKKYESMIMERDSIVTQEKYDTQLQKEYEVSADDFGGL